jgi:hypothetical protein
MTAIGSAYTVFVGKPGYLEDLDIDRRIIFKLALN